MNNVKVFKKSSPNGKLILFLENREFILNEPDLKLVRGVVAYDGDYVKNRKIFGQVMLIFRYGREDEEVMGLRFCNEACLYAAQISPNNDTEKDTSQLQETLVKKFGPNAVAFTFQIRDTAPPSVVLLPARHYSGAPIGTNYDVRIFVGDSFDEKPQRRSLVRMGIKFVHTALFQPALQPYAAVCRQLHLTDGKVSIEASLEKEIFERDEEISVSVTIHNNSRRNVKKIKVMAIQFVDVAMFSNGKFKNSVACAESTNGCPITPKSKFFDVFHLKPTQGEIKNWIALEEFYDKRQWLASSMARPEKAENNVFAIYVNYYVKVKAITSVLGGAVSCKVPFKLMRFQTIDERDTILQKRFPSVTWTPHGSSQSLNHLGLDTPQTTNGAIESISTAHILQSFSKGARRKFMYRLPHKIDDDILKRLKPSLHSLAFRNGENDCQKENLFEKSQREEFKSEITVERVQTQSVEENMNKCRGKSRKMSATQVQVECQIHQTNQGMNSKLIDCPMIAVNDEICHNSQNSNKIESRNYKSKEKSFIEGEKVYKIGEWSMGISEGSSGNNKKLCDNEGEAAKVEKRSIEGEKCDEANLIVDKINATSADETEIIEHKTNRSSNSKIEKDSNADAISFQNISSAISCQIGLFKMKRSTNDKEPFLISEGTPPMNESLEVNSNTSSSNLSEDSSNQNCQNSHKMLFFSFLEHNSSSFKSKLLKKYKAQTISH